MHLFLYDNLLQLDSIVPVINTIKGQKKITISSLNITHNYSNNKLIKYLNQNDIECLTFPPTNIENRIKLFLIRTLLLLPKIILSRFQGFWYRLDEKTFLDKKKFLNFLKEKKIKSINIPNDFASNKKIFLYNLKLEYDLKIIEIEVGLRTLKTDPYEKFPLDYCDFYLATNKFLSFQGFKNKKEFNRKTKFLGSSRYSSQWIKILDEINKIPYKKTEKINVALFLAPRNFEENPNLLNKILKIENINLKISNKPKSILPLKCCDFYYDKFNTNQLINWADIIICHATSIVIEAIIKKKKILFCSFIKYEKKFKILGNRIEIFNCVKKMQNLEEIIENIANFDPEIIEEQNIFFDKDDQSALYQLRGFSNDEEMIKNYINFYENAIIG